MIARDFVMYVENDERRHHFFRIDLIDRAAGLREVRRRIDVRAPLTDVTEFLREEATLKRYV